MTKYSQLNRSLQEIKDKAPKDAEGFKKYLERVAMGQEKLDNPISPDDIKIFMDASKLLGPDGKPIGAVSLFDILLAQSALPANADKDFTAETVGTMVSAPPKVGAPASVPVDQAALGTAVGEYLKKPDDAGIKGVQKAAGLPETGDARYDTFEAARKGLGGPITKEKHPALYDAATARFYEITGLPKDRPPTDVELKAAHKKLEKADPKTVMEFQSVTYLLGHNEERLSYRVDKDGKHVPATTDAEINVDGVYGRRSRTALEATSTALKPPAVDAGAEAKREDLPKLDTHVADPVKPTMILKVNDRDAEDQAFFRGFVPRLEDRYHVVLVTSDREFDQQAAGLKAAGTPFTTFELRESNHTDAPIEAERLRARTDLGETGRFRMEFDANVNNPDDVTKRLATMEQAVGAQYMGNLTSGQAKIERGDTLLVDKREMERVDAALTARAAQPQLQP